MQWLPLDTWIVVIGVLCAMSCALLGNFLVLRRMSMMGDAISHAVLPGLAGGFLLMIALKENATIGAWWPGLQEWAQHVDSRNPIVMLIGAAIVGVLTTLLTQWIHSFGKVDRGAAMGVVFTTLFAIGLILIKRAEHRDKVDLDASCVLYGALEAAPAHTWSMAGADIPRAAVVLGGILLINALAVGVFYKELKITSFDPALATTLGINARAMHYLLMTLVAVTTVASFESIGSILVIAMLIVPAATAHLLTDRLPSMIAVSLIVAALSAALGHVSAITLPRLVGIEDTQTSGMMAVCAGALFLAVALAAPRHGIIVRLGRQWLLRVRIAREDVLGLLYRLEELAHERGASMQRSEVAAALHVGGMTVRMAASGLARESKIAVAGAGYQLTDAGRTAARELVRTHRLWESYLYRHLALPADHVHASAEHLEHVTDAAMRERLAAVMQHPSHDPHGKRVPRDDEE